jgi:hypothetical protein
MRKYELQTRSTVQKNSLEKDNTQNYFSKVFSLRFLELMNNKIIVFKFKTLSFSKEFVLKVVFWKYFISSFLKT